MKCDVFVFLKECWVLNELIISCILCCYICLKSLMVVFIFKVYKFFLKKVLILKYIRKEDKYIDLFFI